MRRSTVDCVYTHPLALCLLKTIFPKMHYSPAAVSKASLAAAIQRMHYRRCDRLTALGPEAFGMTQRRFKYLYFCPAVGCYQSGLSASNFCGQSRYCPFCHARRIAGNTFARCSRLIDEGQSSFVVMESPIRSLDAFEAHKWMSDTVKRRKSLDVKLRQYRGVCYYDSVNPVDTGYECQQRVLVSLDRGKRLKRIFDCEYTRLSDECTGPELVQFVSRFAQYPSGIIESPVGAVRELITGRRPRMFATTKAFRTTTYTDVSGD